MNAQIFVLFMLMISSPFSSNITDHAMHLMRFIKKSRNQGLIPSVKKAEIAKEQIEFLVLKIN